MKDGKGKRIKNYIIDLIVIGVLIAAGLFLMLFQSFRKTGTQVSVRVDGETIAAMNLQEDGEYIILSDSREVRKVEASPEKNGGTYNYMIIKNQQVFFSDASCPDLLCVHQGEVHRQGESIICLPNKVVVEVISGDEGVDAVVH